MGRRHEPKWGKFEDVEGGDRVYIVAGDFHIPRENRSGVVGQRTRGNPTGLSDGSAGLIRQT